MSMGPGWFEDQYLKTLGKLSDGPISFTPWYDPNKKLTPVLEAALAKAFPGVGLSTVHVYPFEALLTVADAYKRAGSTDPKALADAIRTTNITDMSASDPASSSTPRVRTTRSGLPTVQNRSGRSYGDSGAKGCCRQQNRSGHCHPTSAAAEASMCLGLVRNLLIVAPKSILVKRPSFLGSRSDVLRG